MTESGADLQAQVQEFAEDVTARVLMCLEGAPYPVDELRVEFQGGHYAFAYTQTLHAEADGEVIGMLRLDYALCYDRSGQHLAVDSSSFQLRDRRAKKPIVRLEYLRDAHTAPCSHVHVHAESGLFTQLLASTGHESAAAIGSIHLPTGGDRFRPCVEDFVQFLIQECGVAGREGWRDEVDSSREKYRRTQTAAAVRDRPDVAIEELERLGLKIAGEIRADRPAARTRY